MTMKLIFENWRHYISEKKIEVKGKTPEQLISELQELAKSTFIFFDTETMGLFLKNDQITQLAYKIVVPQGQPQETPEDVNMIAHLTDETKKRLYDKDSEERKNWFSSFDSQIEKERQTAERMLKSGKIDSVNYEQRIKNIENKIKNERDPEYILNFTHYDPSKANITEEEMLKTFLNVLKKYPDVVLVAHNAPFDQNAINTRNQKYGLPKITTEKESTEQDLVNILDTLSLCRDHYVPQLERYRNEIDAEINKLSHGKNIQEDEDYESLKAQIKAAGKNADPIKKRLFMLGVLRDAANNQLQNKDLQKENFSSKLGDLAKTFKIDPIGAHEAINDVRMLASIYKNMIEVLVYINDFFKQKEKSLTEFLKEAKSLYVKNL